MKLSVALCTYNGSLYLPEQLASLSAQSRPPDQLVVCDDASEDDTYRILEDFARKTSFAALLHKNKKRLGSTKNFEKCIGLCSGDVIALCDQDDVWLPSKLQRSLDALEALPDAGFVFTDGAVVDEKLRPLGRGLWQQVGFNRNAQHLVTSGEAVKVLLQKNRVTGATMAFHSRFRDLLLPIPNMPGFSDDGILHDEWIALVIAAVANVAFINEELIYYRRHRAQQIGVEGRGGDFKQRLQNGLHNNRPKYLGRSRQFKLMFDRLSACSDERVREDALKLLAAKINHLEARGNMPERRWRRWRTVSKELMTLRYHRFSNGIRSAAKDFILYAAHTKIPTK